MNEIVFYLGAFFTIAESIYNIINHKDEEAVVDISNPFGFVFEEMRKPQFYTSMAVSLWVIVGWFSGLSWFFWGLTFLTGIRVMDAMLEGSKTSFIFNRCIYIILVMAMIYFQYSGIFTV